jgi:2-amino-4-hydroxy-6-hydroxymethyldihydropteridine diphosphokinase
VPAAFLSRGSNLGDKIANLRDAIARLGIHPDISIARISSVYLTEPVGGVEQPDFLNMVAELETSLDPHSLHAVCREIETALGGREGRKQMGPRTIDLDILLYDALKLEEASLTIPHPEMLGRAFVLVPLAEIAPDVVIPGDSTAAKALARCGDTSSVEKYTTLKEPDRP